MTQVFIGIGSNIDRHRHIAAALDSLGETFGELSLSPVYECEAMGFDGPPFLNLVAGFGTALPLLALVETLRQIERANGYHGGAPKFSSRSLDLDLLTYGDLCGDFEGVVLPRPDITAYAYVLWPLADLAGAEPHPRSGISYVELRRQFAPRQPLQAVPFEWRGCDLSAAVLQRPARRPAFKPG